MENFLYLDLLKKYAVETVLVTIAVITAVAAVILFSYDAQAQKTIPLIEKVHHNINNETIIVDVAGAVKKPGIYELPAESRVKDALQKADGFSQDLDFSYVSKTLNQAKILTDQEKLYIPSRETPLPGSTALKTDEGVSQNTELVNLNTAGLDDLDKLPSIGAVTAQKIISGRPYSNIQELLEKKILGPAAFEKIQNMVSVIN